MKRSQKTDPQVAGKVTPKKAKGKPAAKSAKPADQAGKTAKLSAINAAAQLLAESGQAMTCPEMIQAMQDRGLWSSPAGKTPASTLYSSILRELKVRGKEARFQKTERGKFASRPARD